MPSEVRVNQIQNRSGLGTVTLSDSGVSIAGVTTFFGNVNVSTGSSITIGETFIQRNAIGLGATTTTGRNAGIGTAEGTVIYNSTAKEVQVYKGLVGWTNISQSFIEATGGVINDYTSGSTVYRAHVFTSTGTFNVTSGSGPVDYLVVAGGGGGGQTVGGGGGAGGLRHSIPTVSGAEASLSISAGTYPVTVGAGGGGALGSPSYPTGSGTSGTPSIFSIITSQGGGGGGNYGNASNDVKSGGSGGGVGAAAAGAAGVGSRVTGTTTPAPTQGNPGGTSGGNANRGGGGGGAGGAGNNASPTTAGTGGAGLTLSITGISTGYAGGGGGGGRNPGGIATPATDGGGAGGNGGVVGTPGIFATGGGGGAGGYDDAQGPLLWGGGAGGPGIVVVRYQIANLTATAKATGGSISYYNGKTIHTFTGSGTFTAPASFNETVEYVVIGGGGSGGLKNISLSGGGGAGAYRTNSTPIAGPQAITIQVGAGGVIVDNGPAATPASADGTPSYFGTPITAPGGGGGGTYPNPGIGRAGGSSGGGAGGSTPGAAGPASGAPFPGTIGATPTAGWGHAGGTGYPTTPAYGGGGGGGAGGAGGNGSSTAGGNGGAGIQLPTTFRSPQSSVGAPGPTSAPTPNGFDTSGKFWVAGGGAGSAYPTGTPSAPGGGPGGPYAGGGAGGAGVNGGDGGTNTGGGGGGNERSPGPDTQSGRGGSGLVLIAYPS